MYSLLRSLTQDLDEVPKAEPVRAIKNCVWEPKEGMDECVALEGSYFYFSYSWYAGGWPFMTNLHGLPVQ